MRESVYQAQIIRRIENEFPECIVIKNDPRYIQGLPDLLVLFEDTWVMLEIKTSAKAHIQPNQKWYVSKFNDMSYCAFVWPEIEDEVFDAISKSFGARRKTRVSQS